MKSRGRSDRRSRNGVANHPRRASRPRLEFLEDRAVPAAFEVTSLLDSGTGSLREAIQLAASSPGPDTISFASSLTDGTITLTTNTTSTFGLTALVVDADSVTIDGSAAPGLKISGGGERRIFAVGPSGELTLRNLTLTDGLAKGGDGGSGGYGGGGGAGLGGAVYVHMGLLSIESSTLTGHVAQGGAGGAANGSGYTSNGGGGGPGGNGGVGYSVVAPNYPLGSGGGGPSTSGQSGLEGGLGGDGLGGNGGTLLSLNGDAGVIDVVSGLGGGGGGGMGTGGTVSDSGGAGAFGGGGGGGSDSGGVGGFGGGGGGGYFLALGGGAGGFAAGAGGAGGGGGAGLGGAVFNYNGTIRIVNSTLTANSALGGQGGQGDQPEYDGEDGGGLGGAVFNYNGTMFLLNSTIVANIGDSSVHSLGSLSAMAYIDNTIIWAPPLVGPGTVIDLNIQEISGGDSKAFGAGNLFGSQVGYPGGYITSADPMLGPLANNGGPTRTMAPMAGSPVLAAGDPIAAVELSTDQTGAARFTALTVSIGAVESVPVDVAPAITSADSTLFVVGSAGTFTIQTTGTPNATITHSGTLPTGVTLVDNGDGTATLAGTPGLGVEGTYTIIVTAANGVSPDATQTFTLTVNPALAISPATLPGATIGEEYEQQLTATGGSGLGYAFSVVGCLPPGMTLTPEGLLSGWPASTDGAPFEFQVRVEDSFGGVAIQTYSLAVTGLTSTVELTGNSGTLPLGATATFTAVVPPVGEFTVAGSVRFYNGDVELGTVELVDGVAVFSTTALPPGLNMIRAVYSGSSAYQAATSQDLPVSVLIGSSVTANVSPASATPTQPVTVTATVASAVDPYIPGGIVFFYDGDVLLGSGVLNESGQASFTTTSLAVGTHSIVALYNGSVEFQSSASSPVTVVVAKVSGITGVVSADPSQVYYGQGTTLRGTFRAPSAGTPLTGTVAFYLGDRLLGTAPMGLAAATGLAAASVQEEAVGTATLTGVVLPVGGHAIRAVYSGDAIYEAADTTVDAQVVVVAAGTSTTLTASPSGDGSTILTAQVVATTPGDPTLIGTVQFFDGDLLIGTATVQNGVASLNIGPLSQGTHVFRAVFSGDGSASSSSATTTVAATGPQVVGLSRFGVHASPTTLVLTFNSALDPATAQDPANYQIVLTGRRRAAVRIVAAAYDAATNTVTLTPSGRLNLHWTYLLTVVGRQPGGLLGATGVPLDGAGANQPGTDFTTQVTWRNLAAPGSQPAVTYENGQARTTPRNFRQHVDAVLARFASRATAAPRLGAAFFRIRSR